MGVLVPQEQGLGDCETLRVRVKLWVWLTEGERLALGLLLPEGLPEGLPLELPLGSDPTRVKRVKIKNAREMNMPRLCLWLLY